MSDTNRIDRDVVLITVDSLRYDYVFDDSGVQDSFETLKSLIETGTSFSNAFSNAGYTKSSFLSIFSGTYPWMFESVQGGMGPDRPHIADLFSRSGYNTGGFHSNPYLGSAYGYDRGFDYYMGRDRDSDSDVDTTTLSAKAWTFINQRIGSSRISNAVRKLYQQVGSELGIQIGGDPYLTAEFINESVIRWAQETSGPRFIWVHYMDVHTPYYPHEGTVSEDISKRHAVKLFHRVHKEGNDASEDDLELLRRLYRGELDYLDRCIGNLLEDLGKYLNLDETVLAFSSDHGEAFNEHDYIFHVDGEFHDELIHIPLFINGPSFEPRKIDTPVSNVDLLPTLLSAADIPVPESCVGDDLQSLAADPPDERLVFAEGYTEVDGKVMLTTGEYKLIHHLGDGETRLYNRYEDPEEQHDRTDEEPEVRDRLLKAVNDHAEMARNHTGEGRMVDVDEEVRDRLRRLGYAE